MLRFSISDLLAAPSPSAYREYENGGAGTPLAQGENYQAFISFGDVFCNSAIRWLAAAGESGVNMSIPMITTVRRFLASPAVSLTFRLFS